MLSAITGCRLSENSISVPPVAVHAGPLPGRPSCRPRTRGRGPPAPRAWELRLPFDAPKMSAIRRAEAR